MLEEAGSREDFESHLKQKVLQDFFSDSEFFERCLDFQRAINPEENLNAAEYAVGATLLLWIRKTFGNQIMLDTLRATLDPTERDDSVKQNHPDTQHEDAHPERNLKAVFNSQGITDVKHRYLRWLMEESERTEPVRPRAAIDLDTIMERITANNSELSDQGKNDFRKKFEGHLCKYNQMELTLPVSDEPMRRISQVLTENSLITVESCEGHGERLPRVFLKCEDQQKLKELAFVVARASSYRTFPWQAEIWCSDPSDPDSPLTFILSPSQRHQPIDPRSNHKELVRDIDALGLNLMIHFDSLKER